MASLFGMVKSFTKKILKNPIKSAIVAFLIWQILKKEETKVENMDIQEQIKVLKKKGNKQLVFDTTSKKYAVIVGTNIKVFDNEQKARKAFGESLKEARDPILKGYSLDKLEKLIRIYKQFNDPESKRFTKELEKELKMRNKQSVSKRLSNSKERITTLHEKIILKEQGRQMTQANLKAFGESLKEAKKLSPDDERGLKGWVKDYKKARKAGNVRLAKQIRDNIVKVLKKLGVREPFKHPIWGRDPRLESTEVNKMNYEERITDLKFDDRETAKQAGDILKKKGIKFKQMQQHLIFNDEQDKQKAKKALTGAGMRGLQSQSVKRLNKLHEKIIMKEAIDEKTRSLIVQLAKITGFNQLAKDAAKANETDLKKIIKIIVRKMERQIKIFPSDVAKVFKKRLDDVKARAKKAGLLESFSRVYKLHEKIVLKEAEPISMNNINFALRGIEDIEKLLRSDNVQKAMLELKKLKTFLETLRRKVK